MGKQPDINPRDLYDAVAKLTARVKSLEKRLLEAAASRSEEAVAA